MIEGVVETRHERPDVNHQVVESNRLGVQHFSRRAGLERDVRVDDVDEGTECWPTVGSCKLAVEKPPVGRGYVRPAMCEHGTENVATAQQFFEAGAAVGIPRDDEPFDALVLKSVEKPALVGQTTFHVARREECVPEFMKVESCEAPHRLDSWPSTKPPFDRRVVQLDRRRSAVYSPRAERANKPGVPVEVPLDAQGDISCGNSVKLFEVVFDLIEALHAT